MLSGDPAVVFERVVRMVGELFEVRVVCLSQISGHELLFKAVYVNGQVIADAGHCPLHITPCATVEQSQDLRIYDRVQESFPEAAFLREHNARAYCGFPSLSTEGKVIAVTCLLDDQPRVFSDNDQHLLRIIGQRIAAEVERGVIMAELKRAGDKLRASENRYRAVVEAQTELVCRWNLTDGVTFINDAVCRYLTLPREQILGRSFELYVVEEDRPALQAHITTLKPETPVGSIEHRVRLPSGELRWMHWADLAIFDANGCLIEFQSVGRDITEGRRNETAFRNLVAGTASVTGVDFFKLCVRHLAEALGVRYSFLIQRVPHTAHTLQIVAAWGGTDWLPSEDFDMRGTPCELIVNEKREVCYTDRVQEAFPTDEPLKALGTVSYLGLPLLDRDGDALGHLCILDDKPLAAPERAREILRVFSSRAAAEMERERVVEALRRSTEQMHQLNRRVLEVQEAERRRLARELHDQVGASLTAVQLNLGALLRSKTQCAHAERLEEALRTLDEVIERVQDISFDLRPSVLDDLGLMVALRAHLKSLGQRAGFRTRFIGDDLPTPPGVPIETACFRIAQEALTNVVRHARAGSVTVQLRREGPSLHLNVRDDGGGFDLIGARATSNHDACLGLLGMEERAMLMGGRLEIKSSPGGGTEVHAWFPLAGSVSAGETRPGQNRS